MNSSGRGNADLGIYGQSPQRVEARSDADQLATFEHERAMNPFMRAKDAADLGRIRELKDNF